MSKGPYVTPKEYLLALHFPRSRLQKNLKENLYYLSLDLVSLGTQSKSSFEKNLNERLRTTLSASELKGKTIDNIRTEMLALFGLVKEDYGYYSPTKRTEELARTGDTKRFFKSFCHLFQWPGGFNKKRVTKKLVMEGVAFKPGQYILSILMDAISEPAEKYLTVPEVCHMIFNDKRVTAGHEDPEQCWERILENRKNGVKYSKPSDVIRYARDFLRFMCEAGLLVESGNAFSSNEKEAESINAIMSSKTYFKEFNETLEGSVLNEAKLDKAQNGWLGYFGGEASLKQFERKVEDIVDISEETKTVSFEDITGKVAGKAQPAGLRERKFVPVEFLKARSEKADIIGAIGEDVVLNYEKHFLEENGRSDLAVLVENVSENAALGYDIESFELDGKKRYIEVKTTESPDPQLQFVITSAQLNTAKELEDSYSIYRVQIKSRTVFSIQVFRNPYKLCREGKINLRPKDYWVRFSLK